MIIRKRETNPTEKKGKKNMKAITYIRKIKETNSCSIHLAEKLTEALHREELMGEDLAVRFRPLFGDFDIVNADFETVGVNHCDPTNILELESTVLSLMDIYARSRKK